ncbi:hypothetical protein WJX81_008080 [Elliptochloris bilobata]|uniref:Protein CASP n=1 Tax=Elliptochloris bilobata TaxID=381761 RepID=A0AAW1QZD7_9CHLO
MSSAQASPPASAVCSFWKDFDLESFRHKLDQEGLSIAEKQELSLKSRRRLADTTRNFKRSSEPAVLQAVGALLKAYQEEVDRLTNRAKFGEAAFLDVYQKLYEAPDPAPTLNGAMEASARCAELEAAARNLAGELADFKAESKQLRNQELTIRRLEERARSLEAQLEVKEAEAEAARRDAAEEAASRAADAEAAREAALAAQLEEARASLAALQRQAEAGQRAMFSLQAASEAETAGLQAQLELAGAEVERAHARMAALELQRERAAQAAQPQAGEREQRRDAEEALRSELRAQRELAARLQREAARAAERAESQAGAALARAEATQRALEAAEARACALDAQLASRATPAQVAELRQQARRLEHDLTMARLRIVEACGEAEAASARTAEAEARADAAQELVQRLEEDLLAAQLASSSAGDAGRAGSVSGDGGAGSDHLSTALAQDSNGVAGGATGERTMAGVLAAQRDRLRARVAPLEEAVAQATAEAASLRSEVAAARADNVALVERLRFVQGYAQQQRTRKDAGGGDVESRYAGAYEERVNPFRDFLAGERAARRRQLNALDRIVFELGQLVSSSRWARACALAYMLLLHALVFISVARLSHRHVMGVLPTGAELARLCQRAAERFAPPPPVI